MRAVAKDDCRRKTEETSVRLYGKKKKRTAGVDVYLKQGGREEKSGKSSEISIYD